MSSFGIDAKITSCSAIALTLLIFLDIQHVNDIAHVSPDSNKYKSNSWP